MNNPITDERLSAYLDDELTPSERESVDRDLENDDRHQATLDDLREVSSVVRKLPALTAPDDLHAVVMQQVRARSQAPASATVKPSESSTGWNWRIAGSLLASAALLLVMVRVMDVGEDAIPAPLTLSSPEPGPLNQQIANQQIAASEATAEMAMTNNRRSPADSDVAAGAPAAPVQDAQFRAPQSKVAGMEFADTASVKTSPAEMTGAAVPAVPRAVPPQVFFAQRFLKDGETPRRGEVLSYLQTHGDQVLVIEVTVVDVAQVADRISVLLNETGIKSVAESSEQAQEEAVAEVGSSPQLRAIFVETDSDRLMAALESAGSQKEVLEMRVHRPSEVARIESGLQSDGASAENLAAVTPAETGDANAPADAASPSKAADPADGGGYVLDREVLARLRQQRAEAPSRKKQDSDRPATADAYQLAMNVPSELVDRLAGRKDADASSTVQDATNQADATTPMQVLFVLSAPR